MQGSDRGSTDVQHARQESGRVDGAAFTAKLAAMSPAEREAHIPKHSDGQVCR